MNKSAEVLIVGSGALATLFAGRLSAAGMPVSMLGSWNEGLAALERDGAVLVNPNGQEQSYPVRILNYSGPAKPFKFALVLVKSWQTRLVAEILPAYIQQDGLALTLQNGLGNREILEKWLGSERIAQGVTTLGGTLLGPGCVRLGGEGALSVEAHPRFGPLADLLRQAGFQVNIVPEATPLVWGKLVVNSGINPLSAVLRVTNGELLQHPARRYLLAELARETAALAVARGITLPYPDPVLAAEEVARRTGSNRSSMLQDVLRGAPTEIESISGAIFRLGQTIGQATPLNACMYRLVQALTPAV